MTNVTVRPVLTSRDREAFLRLPWKLHSRDQDWVPPLLGDARKTLSPDYPFFDHGSAQWLLAFRGSDPVGRLTAHINRAHLEKYGDGRGFFGWFECEDSAATAEALFGAGIDWLLEQKAGLTHIRGPLNWDINGECPGILIHGESEPGLPVVLMAHSPAHYQRLVESAGFTKAMDLLAYISEDGPDVDEKLERLGKLASAARRRLPDLSFRHLDTGSGYARDMEIVRGLFNSAWAENWGSLDLSPREMDIIARGLKPVARPELTSVVTVGGVPAGCLVCIPDINPILRKINGKLLPFGWLTFLLRLGKIKTFRTMLMGVSAEFRGRGLDAIMVAEVIKDARLAGFNRAELSWVLETNQAMNSIASKLGRVYRRYRIYEREL